MERPRLKAHFSAEVVDDSKVFLLATTFNSASLPRIAYRRIWGRKSGKTLIMPSSDFTIAIASVRLKT